MVRWGSRETKKFLSTPSARRATGASIILSHFAVDFYPRPPRGGRRLAEPSSFSVVQFLSTPSARRATPSNWLRKSIISISIHALREEGDRRLRPVRAPRR